MATTHITPITPVIGERISIRPWNRRHDRQQIDRWPPYFPALPAHWLVAPAPAPADERVSYAVDLRSVDRLVGRIGLRMSGADAQISIVLHPDHLGAGIGTESLHHINRLARMNGLARLWLDVAAENIRAIRCYERVGFVGLEETWRSGYRYMVMARGL